MTQQTGQFERQSDPVSPVISFAVGLLAVVIAVDAALLVLPAWLPGMVSSITGENVKIYWYLSRGSAVSGYVLLWMSMVLGLLMTNRMSKHWPGAPVANDLHQYVSLLGLVFVAFHALILIGDSFIKLDLGQILLPFGSQSYRPFQVGLGQLAVYGWIILTCSFYVKKHIGVKTWRAIHYASFILFLFAMLHGITSGTDSGTVWMQAIYWVSAASLVFLTAYRVIMALANRLVD